MVELEISGFHAKKEQKPYIRTIIGEPIYKNSYPDVPIDEPFPYFRRKKLVDKLNSEEEKHYFSPSYPGREKQFVEFGDHFNGICFPKENNNLPPHSKREKDVDIYTSLATHVEIKRAIVGDPEYIFHTKPDFTEFDLFLLKDIKTGHRFTAVLIRFPTRKNYACKQPEIHEIKTILRYINPSYYCYDYGDYQKYYTYKKGMKIKIG